MLDINSFTGLVRSYIKDKDTKNRLAGNEYEFDLGEVYQAVKIAVMRINNTHQPITVYTADTCPEYLLLMGTASQLMQAQIILKARNYINVSDSVSQMNREGNIALYQSIRATIEEEFANLLYTFKTNLNIEQGYPS